MTDLIFKENFDHSKLNKSDTIAYLGLNRNFSDYIRQYRLAINIIVVQLEKKEISNFDLISLPTLYIIRHLYELIAKKYILFFQRVYSIGIPHLKLNSKSHKISELTNPLKDYLKAFVKNIPDKNEKAIINAFIKIIEKMSYHLIPVDDNSFKLRYHIDTSFQLCFDSKFQINCKELLDDYYIFIDFNDKAWYLSDLYLNEN